MIRPKPIFRNGQTWVNEPFVAICCLWKNGAKSPVENGASMGVVGCQIASSLGTNRPNWPLTFPANPCRRTGQIVQKTYTKWPVKQEETGKKQEPLSARARNSEVAVLIPAPKKTCLEILIHQKPAFQKIGFRTAKTGRSLLH